MAIEARPRDLPAAGDPCQASRHSALSYEHAGKIEAQLQAEVAELMARAEAADQADVADGMSIPDELARREERLAKLAQARATIEARAKERYTREQAEHRAKMAARDAKTAATGKKPGGKPPSPPVAGPGPTDQVNLTDEESRIMPVAGGGFEQAYNAQAMAAAGSLLVVAIDVVQAPNDKQQLQPMLGKLGALPEELGKAETLLADTGYFSEANVRACVAAGIDPLIAMGRQAHHPPLAERFAPAPPPPDNPTPVEAMAHRLKTPEGKKLYALRKQTPEPVFGIIKSALGFRQFLLRGLDNVRGEWNLVCLQHEADIRPRGRVLRRQSRLAWVAPAYAGTAIRSGQPSERPKQKPSSRDRPRPCITISQTSGPLTPLRQAARQGRTLWRLRHCRQPGLGQYRHRC